MSRDSRAATVASLAGDDSRAATVGGDLRRTATASGDLWRALLVLLAALLEHPRSPTNSAKNHVAPDSKNFYGET